MKSHIGQLALALGLLAAHVAGQSGQIAEGAGEITGVPAPGSTVDNPQIDLGLFRPFCVIDDDCESEVCENGPQDINVQNITGIFYCGPPTGEKNCQTVAAAAAEPGDDVLEFQRPDGICNNLVPGQELFGSTGHLQLRRMNGVPLNMIEEFTGAPDVISARQISDEILDQVSSIPNPFGASTLLVYTGQFIDHDFTLIEFQPPDTRGVIEGTPPLADEVEFELSVDVPGSEPILNPQGLTSWIDLSMVYGSDIETAFNLRDPAEMSKLDSLIRQGQEFLPRAQALDADGRSVITAMSPMLPGLFAAGDIRVNEQIMLTSFHTLFMREHNRLVGTIPPATLRSLLGDNGIETECLPITLDELAVREASPACELIYQLARRVNIAQWQNIVFTEYFDSWHNLDQEIGGPNSLPPFVYNDTLSPDMDIFVSTASYRFGHTGVVNYVVSEDPNAEDPGAQSVFLGNAFFNPDAVLRTGIGPLLNGAANQCHEKRDAKVVTGIRNFLFGSITNSDLANMDLISFNIERGRDHQIALYNDARMFYNLEPLNTFEQVVSAGVPGLRRDCLAAELSATFNGNVDNCSPFVCGLAEPATKGELGETWFAAQDDQFRRCRDADRFYFENLEGPTPEQLTLAGSSISLVQEVRMSTILNRNTFGTDRIFGPSVFQSPNCCTLGGEGDQTVCVRPVVQDGVAVNLRTFEAVPLDTCEAQDKLNLLNFYAGTMNPLSFRPYGCACRPALDNSNTLALTIVVQNRPAAETPDQFIEALRVEMFQLAQVDEAVEGDRFPAEEITYTDLGDGTVQVISVITPTDNTELFQAAEEIVGELEVGIATNAIGAQAIMSNGNMQLTCMDCSPLPQAAGGEGVVDGGAQAAGLLGQSTAVGAGIIAAIVVAVLVLGCGVRFYMKRNSSPNFTSGQESV